MKTLYLLVGLPRSGKSTKAQTMEMPIVCPDAIRKTLHGQAFRRETEPMVWAIAKTMVQALFHAGHDKVVLDACAITHAHRKEWHSREWDTRCVYVYADYDLKINTVICVQRAIKNGQEYLIPVIESMAEKFQPLLREWDDNINA